MAIKHHPRACWLGQAQAGWAADEKDGVKAYCTGGDDCKEYVPIGVEGVLDLHKPILVKSYQIGRDSGKVVVCEYDHYSCHDTEGLSCEYPADGAWPCDTVIALLGTPEAIRHMEKVLGVQPDTEILPKYQRSEDGRDAYYVVKEGRDEQQLPTDVQLT